LDSKIIWDEKEYTRMFYEHMASKDEEFIPFLAEQRKFTLSERLIEEIMDSIKDDRNAMIEEAKINYPLKTFQGIDMDLRYAIVMPNLSSEH
jgi:hypothetical protein